MARINVGKGDIELSDSDIVDLRGNDTYCPMVYDEQTIREAFRKCVGFADGVNKISDFPSVTPASSDKILIEQGGEGKSAPLESLPIPTSVQSGLNTKVNYTDSLTYEEIMATTDLTNKVASASAVKYINSVLSTKLYYVGNLDSIANIKAWVMENKPSVPWVAYAVNEANGVVLGTPYNTYSKGYVGFIYFGYFSSSIIFYNYNDGSWNQ